MFILQLLEDITNDEPLYNGCKLTRNETNVLIAGFVLRYNVTDVGLESLLQLLNCILPVPVFSSKYKFLKNFDVPKQKLQTFKKFYCAKCSKLLVGNVCPKCKEEKNKKKCEFFLQCPLQAQLEELINGPYYNEILRYKANQIEKKQYSDVCNGVYCQNLREKGGIAAQDITIQLNTDGISPMKSSSTSIWPLLVMVNELPYRLRYQCMMIAGLWNGRNKPPMDLFLNAVLMEELACLSLKGI